MTNQEKNARTANETHRANPPASDYIPTIGRPVLNEEDFTPALAYLREHTNSFFQMLPFVGFLLGDPLKEMQYKYAGGQPIPILDTLPKHRDYDPDRFNSKLECRIVRPRIIEKFDAGRRYARVLLQVEERDGRNQLREERAMLLDHTGTTVSDEELSKGFRVPLATIGSYDFRIAALQTHLAPFLPATVTLGPVQPIQDPAWGETAQ